MTSILKIGGSLITDKTQRETVDDAALDRLSSILHASGDTDLVLIHGGGSFGHAAATDHGITTESGSNDPRVIKQVADTMDRLNDIVIARLQSYDIPAVGLPPRAIVAKTESGELDCSALAVEAILKEGMVPVLHGDIVLHAGTGASILSGDTLAVVLAERLEIDSVGFCAGIPGVLDQDGTVIRRISAFEDVADVLGSTEGADVTGGMSTKVKALLSLDVPGAIFGLDDLAAFLNGDLPGTAVNAGDTDTF